MKPVILHIDNLNKSFEGLQLLKNAQLSIQEGTINSLFGNNGSGKTTLFNMIAGYEKPDSGTINFNNHPVNYRHPHKVALAGIGKMWQEPAIFPNHTVLENLLVSDKVHPGQYFLNYLLMPRSIRQKEEALKIKAGVILHRFKLGEKLTHKAGTLSLGERKLLNISMLFMNDTRLFLLDEPFSNINPGSIGLISAALNEIKSEGKTILMIEHKAKYASAISDHLFRISGHCINPE